MKIFITGLFLICFIFTEANARVNFVPSDVEKYEKTGICPKCDLSGAWINGKENSQLQGTILNGANLIGNFDNSDFSGAFIENAMALDQRQFASCIFKGVNFSDSIFEDANFSGGDFTNANLSRANFSGSTMTTSNFTSAKLTGANLANVDFTGSNITRNQLQSAKTFCSAILPDGSKAAPCI